MKKIRALLGVVIILALVSFLESTASPFTNSEEYVPSLAIIPTDDEQTETTETTTTDTSDDIDLTADGVESSLELKLKETELVDGFIVETYEEFEVYTDKDGKVIKSEPTGKFEYLKYEE